jgi:hypothetical protein
MTPSTPPSPELATVAAGIRGLTVIMNERRSRSM